MRLVFIFFFLVSLSIRANAGWVDGGKVTKIHSGHSEDVLYFNTEVQHEIAGCNNSTYIYVGIGKHGDRMLSVLLAAYLSQKPVSIYLVGGCLHAQPEVNAVQMKESNLPY